MMQESLIQALGIMDCSVLQRTGAHQFTLLHCNESWFYKLMPESAISPNGFNISGESAYLSDFLIDAEEFWQIGNEGQIKSGIWSESCDGIELQLEAVAAVAKGDAFLIINNMAAEYLRQQKTLQTARELLISNDKTQAEYDYLHERLEIALQQNHALQKQNQPVQVALTEANFGVIICDAKLHAVMHNPKAFEIFELEPDKDKQTPLDIILPLFKHQCAEHERLLHTEARWDGELFWFKPPYTSKWLRTALYPVKNEQQQVLHWVFIISDVTREKYLTQRNEKLVLTDNVTGLPNRQSFWQSLELLIEISLPFFILYLDLRNFRQVNELYGHQTGDQVLHELAERLNHVLGPDDICARIGGNEFGVIFNGKHTLQACQQFAEQAIEAMQRPLYTDNDGKVQMAVGVGAAHFPSDASNSEDLMKFADLAMFEAKKDNKSNIRFYSKALKDAAMRRLELHNSLRSAVENHQFELYLQPIVNVSSQKIIKAEALIRWRLPDGTLVNPDQFIPLAEQTGLIVPIGKWVIAEAAQILKRIMQFDPSLKISVNLSPRQISDRGLFDFVSKTLKSNGLPPSHFELELTEGVLVDSYEKAMRLLSRVREQGMTTSIDDFGTGYSSLSYLQKLPIDNLKIDRSFIRDVDTSESAKALVMAIISMARGLNLDVIAEGVENQQQLAFLMNNQCQSAQGYFFSEPLAYKDFFNLLKK